MRQVLHVSREQLTTDGKGFTVSSQRLAWDLGRGWPQVFLYEGNTWMYRQRKTAKGAIYRADTGGVEIEVTR